MESVASVIRVVLYARYSIDLQDRRSIDDQIRLCRDYISGQPNWNVIRTYRDEAISGATLILRPDMQALLRAAQRREFDVVVTEALDRLSRNQADIAHLFERLCFFGVKLVTVSEGEINELHIGLKGTMNALFRKDLAAKVHRGMTGRVLEGKCATRPAYGYEILKHVDTGGEPIRGDRKINDDQAEIVRRIFRQYANGVSPWKIAQRLNQDGIPSPEGGVWSDAAIRGYDARGTGILNNEIYIGKLIWNRIQVLKHPDTGKEVKRVNPRKLWIITEVPKLRIVSDELWKAVKDRQHEVAAKYAKRRSAIGATKASDAGALSATHRARHLLSGLLVCGYCRSHYISGGGGGRLYCSKYLHSRSCTNKRSIIREMLEARVLAGLRGPLMDQNIIDEAMRNYADEMRRLLRGRRSSHDQARKKLTETEKALAEVVAAIKQHGYSRTLGDTLRELETNRDEFEKRLSAVPAIEINIPQIEKFREKIDHLAESLRCPHERDEAISLIRGLIDHIAITPEPKRTGKIALALHGDFAAVLERMACGERDLPLTISASVDKGSRVHRSRDCLVIGI